MANTIRGLCYTAGATAVLLLAVVFASTAGTAVAQSDMQRAYPLRGQISSVQLDNEGNPEWIQSGIWVMRVIPGDADSDLPTVHLIARMSMVMVDGNAMHQHTITNFELTSLSSESDTVNVFEGTATVSMRDGPVSDVPVTVKIFNNAVIGIWLDPEALDSHFGDGPVYGTLSPLGRTLAGQMHERMMMSDRGMMSQ
jgi:hypothetical protein